MQISAIAALLVFLAACMSAANLALSRIAARRHELALRMALGVRRWRLARHLLTEALLLSLVAGAIGAGVGAVGHARDSRRDPAELRRRSSPGGRGRARRRARCCSRSAPRWRRCSRSPLLPVLRATRMDLAGVLSEGGRASTGGMQSTRMRATLIVLEVSIALVLLTAATLFTRSVRNMMRRRRRRAAGPRAGDAR